MSISLFFIIAFILIWLFGGASGRWSWYPNIFLVLALVVLVLKVYGVINW